MPERKPIGYWLKELDHRIESTLDRALAEDGLNRRQWQVMNVLGPAPAAREDVLDALRPFGETGAAIDELVERGWALRDAEARVALSAEGERVKGALLERIKELRMSIADGVTPEQYNTTIDTLEKMAANLAALEG